MNKKLTLVGAGPGDEELITLKGIKALQQADVVLYDALVNENLLKHANSALKVFVGKRYKYAALQQDEINELILYYAERYSHVVRLKGGDPFVFGRGFEELLYAASHGIHVEVIPGISSSIGVPTSIGLPLTTRGTNQSFWVMTGTSKSDSLSNDIRLAIQTNSTIVILMGINRIKEIVSLYLQANKPTIPIAIIENGTTPQQRIAIGTASSIVEIVQSQKLTNPAIIVIGEVVGLYEQLIKQNE
ncbi:MAG: uroporphyrinogen-III C-methyltransferase [Cytophagales bacterium]|nr:uroporphyrinogen-III C-methyltransferase [Cytophagales bacterium]MDW8383605.1 uroporphyrinogen-III C-methyltransferase [Flammeovirgaceae bacterium]